MPLWQMYLIEGLPDGRVACFAKMHHSTVDGVTGANMMSQLCTLTPDDPALDPEIYAAVVADLLPGVINALHPFSPPSVRSRLRFGF